MLVFVLVLIAVVVLAALSLGVMMFLEMTVGDGQRVVAEREQTARKWRPPYARGAELRAWARSLGSRTVEEVLTDGSDAAAPTKLVAKLNEGVSRAMLPLASPVDAARAVPCPEVGQGVVGVSVPEAIALADYLRQSVPPTQVQRIRQESEANAKRIELRPSQGGLQTPCSLQGDDCMCMAFAARPLECRPLHAALIAQELGLDVGQDAASWSGHTEGVGEGLAEGLALGLEAAGLDANVYELHSALVTALDHPDAAERWANGEDLFSSCRLHKPG